MTFSPAVKSIYHTYDIEQLSDIAQYGCSTGVASAHITDSETSEFFDKYESDIQESLANKFGDNFMSKYFADCDDIAELKNNMVYAFIELVASDYMDKLGPGDGDEEDEEESDSYFHVYWENGYLLNTIGRFDTKEEAMKCFLSEAEKFKASPGKYTGDNPEDWKDDENAQPHIGFDYVDEDEDDNDYEINSYSLDDGFEQEVKS